MRIRIRWGDLIFSLMIATAIVLFSRGEIVGAAIPFAVAAGIALVQVVRLVNRNRNRDRGDKQ